MACNCKEKILKTLWHQYLNATQRFKSLQMSVILNLYFCHNDAGVEKIIIENEKIQNR